MELTVLLEKLKMDHLELQLDAVCEQASAKEMDYKTFLSQALETEWLGRYQRGIETRLRQARFPRIKTHLGRGSGGQSGGGGLFSPLPDP